MTIKAKESVALVGEIGSGKSSVINLIMRFYDPDFGEILIDGKNIKEYNIQELRKRMGIVLQNPTIFNYTIKDNLLYGNMKASNHQLAEAAKIANATEFIESDVFVKSLDDKPSVLYNEFKKVAYKKTITDELGKDYFPIQEDIKRLNDKENEEGSFDLIKDVIDSRTDFEKGDLSLHEGWEIGAGVNGSKLTVS
jgi:ABC-type sugar transport system ATPase subunit